MAFCGNCGCKNPEINRFCLNCGAKLYYSYDQYLDANGKPHEGEIERIGGAPPAPAQGNDIPIPVVMPEPQNTQGYQQPYQQNYQPPVEPQAEQEPIIMSPYAEANEAPVQQPPAEEPPQQTYQQMPTDAPQEEEKRSKFKFSLAAPDEVRRPVEYLNGCPNNNKNFRFIGMGTAVVAFVFLILGLTVFSLSGNGINYGSILSIGLGENGTIVLVFAIITLLIGIIAVLIPIFNVISGISLIGSLMLILMNTAVYPTIDSTSMILIIAMAVLSIAMGVLSSVFMMKYVRSNARNVTMMQCSVMAWMGPKKPAEKKRGII